MTDFGFSASSTDGDTSTCYDTGFLTREASSQQNLTQFDWETIENERQMSLNRPSQEDLDLLEDQHDSLCVNRQNPSTDDEYDFFLVANQSRRGLSALLSISTGPLEVGGRWQINKSVFEKKNHPEMFVGVEYLYENDNKAGRALNAKLANPLRKTDGTIEPAVLYRAGAQKMGHMNAAWAVADIVPLAVNGALIINSTDPTTPEEELQRTALYGDTVTLAAYTADTAVFAGGYYAASRGSEELANSLLTKAHYGNIATYSLSFITSGFILGLEFVHYANTGEVNNSTVLNSTVNMSSNAAGISLSLYLVYKSKEVATAGASLATQNVILMQATSYSPALTKLLRFGRGAGPLVGMITSGASFIIAYNDDTLPVSQRDRTLWGSGFCFVSASVFFAGALFAAAASAPVTITICVIGSGFFIAGMLVEFQDPLKSALASAVDYLTPKALGSNSEETEGRGYDRFADPGDRGWYFPPDNKTNTQLAQIYEEH